MLKKTSIQQSSNFSTNNLGEIEDGSYGGYNSKQQQLADTLDGLICFNTILIMILLFLEQVPRVIILYVEIAFTIIFAYLIPRQDGYKQKLPKLIIKKHYKKTKINIFSNNKNINK